MQPLVTAVITTYKRSPDTVRRALSSIVSQTYPNLEIYVINDYPNDKQLVADLGDMIQEYTGKREIHYIVVDKNGGACRARNIALEQAKGKYFACLDDDDEWLPEKISKQVSRAEDSETLSIVYCNATIRYEESGKEILKYKNQQSEGNIFYELLGRNYIGSCSYPLMRTEYLKQVGGFNVNMPALQDWELYLRLLKRYPEAGYVHDLCAVYYRHEGERISAHPENRIRAYETIHQAFLPELEKNQKSASSFYMMGTYFYSMGSDLKKAMEYYKKGVKNDPANIKRNAKDLVRMLGRVFVLNKTV